MGRYWSTRRAGSRGPATAVGTSVLLALLEVTQEGAGSNGFADWTRIGPSGVVVTLDYEYFAGGVWNPLIQHMPFVQDEFDDSGIVPSVADNSLLWRVTASAPGYLSVTSAPMVMLPA